MKTNKEIAHILINEIASKDNFKVEMSSTKMVILWRYFDDSADNFYFHGFLDGSKENNLILKEALEYIKDNK